MKKVNTSGDDSAVVSSTKRPVLAASACVFRGQEVLLIKRNQEPFKGQWGLPGGKVQFGETISQAAKREVLEETGITVQVIGPAGLYEIFTDLAHYSIAAHAAVYVSGEVNAASDAAEAKFVEIEELKVLQLVPHTLESIAAARKLIRI
jgi:8-oxo-dGTP diphosphatase